MANVLTIVPPDEMARRREFQRGIGLPARSARRSVAGTIYDLSW